VPNSRSRSRKPSRSKKSSAQIPFMTTQKMKQELYALGYTARDIGKMTAREAHTIIKITQKKVNQYITG